MLRTCLLQAGFDLASRGGIEAERLLVGPDRFAVVFLRPRQIVAAFVEGPPFQAEFAAPPPRVGGQSVEPKGFVEIFLRGGEIRKRVFAAAHAVHSALQAQTRVPFPADREPLPKGEHSGSILLRGREVRKRVVSLLEPPQPPVEGHRRSLIQRPPLVGVEPERFFEVLFRRGEIRERVFPATHPVHPSPGLELAPVAPRPGHVLPQPERRLEVLGGRGEIRKGIATDVHAVRPPDDPQVSSQPPGVGPLGVEAEGLGEILLGGGIISQRVRPRYLAAIAHQRPQARPGHPDAGLVLTDANRHGQILFGPGQVRGRVLPVAHPVPGPRPPEIAALKPQLEVPGAPGEGLGEISFAGGEVRDRILARVAPIAGHEEPRPSPASKMRQVAPIDRQGARVKLLHFERPAELLLRSEDRTLADRLAQGFPRLFDQGVLLHRLLQGSDRLRELAAMVGQDPPSRQDVRGGDPGAWIVPGSSPRHPLQVDAVADDRFPEPRQVRPRVFHRVRAPRELRRRGSGTRSLGRFEGLLAFAPVLDGVQHGAFVQGRGVGRILRERALLVLKRLFVLHEGPVHATHEILGLRQVRRAFEHLAVGGFQLGQVVAHPVRGPHAPERERGRYGLPADLLKGLTRGGAFGRAAGPDRRGREEGHGRDGAHAEPERASANPPAQAVGRMERPGLDGLPRQVPSQVLREGLRRRISPPGILLQGLERDRLEVGRDAPDDFAGQRGFGCEDLRIDFGHGFVRVRGPPRQHFVEDRPQRVDVGGRCDRASGPVHLFGRHVHRRSQRRGRSSQRDIRIDELRQSEVRDLGLARGGDQDVLGFQVPVDDPLFVRVVNGSGHLVQKLHLAPKVDRIPFQEPAQRVALHELHHQVEAAGLLTEVVDRNHVRVGQPRHCLRLPEEPVARRSRLEPGFLEGHPPPKGSVPGLPDHPGASAADRFRQHVPPQHAGDPFQAGGEAPARLQVLDSLLLVQKGRKLILREVASRPEQGAEGLPDRGKALFLETLTQRRRGNEAVEGRQLPQEEAAAQDSGQSAPARRHATREP